MTLVIQDEGLKNKLESVRSTWNSTALKLHLYKTNVTPSTSPTVGSFTECDFAGYAAQNIVTWGPAAVTSHVAKIVAAANTFTRSSTGAGQTVYGYYVTDSGSTLLQFAELDPGGPRTLTNAGDSVTVTVEMSDQSL